MEVVTFPGSPFRLHQPFAPAGDQPTAIEKLTEGLNDGLAYQTLLGVTGSGKTYTMANVIARVGRPALVLAQLPVGAAYEALRGAAAGTAPGRGHRPCGHAHSRYRNGL